ncbi:MAG: hypothetical protein JHC95_13845 [Solirubrobacteraceae bacterium]|nr:hypothetical protein [Solirubrobacteraceae bacterium]
MTLLITRLASYEPICTDVVVQVGKEPVVESCESLGLADLLPFWIIAVALLLPDLTELALPGLGTLRFRVDEQEKGQQAIEAKLVDVQNSIAVGASQATNVLVNVGRLEENLGEKEASFREATRPTESASNQPSPAPTPVGDEDAIARESVTLLNLWDRRLWPWTEVARYARGKKWGGLVRGYAAGTLENEVEKTHRDTLQRVLPDGMTLLDIERIVRWSEVFADEIAAVRAGRNAVAHPGSAPRLTQEDLHELVAIGERIAGVLEEDLDFMSGSAHRARPVRAAEPPTSTRHS